MTLARAGLVTLLALTSVAPAVAQSAPKAEPVISRPVVPLKSRQEAEQQPPEQDPPPTQKELLEAAARLHAEAEAEVEALAYIEVVADSSESSVARKQAALAIKEIKGVSSWFVVLRLRVREDDKDVDVRAALTAIKPPDTPYGLHNVITSNWHLREASPEFVLACETLVS